MLSSCDWISLELTNVFQSGLPELEDPLKLSLLRSLLVSSARSATRVKVVQIVAAGSVGVAVAGVVAIGFAVALRLTGGRVGFRVGAAVLLAADDTGGEQHDYDDDGDDGNDTGGDAGDERAAALLLRRFLLVRIAVALRRDCGRLVPVLWATVLVGAVWLSVRGGRLLAAVRCGRLTVPSRSPVGKRLTVCSGRRAGTILRLGLLTIGRGRRIAVAALRPCQAAHHTRR